MDGASNRHTAEVGRRERAARIAACALVSIAMAASPMPAFADEANNLEEDTLIAGQIDYGTSGDADGAEGLEGNFRVVASEAAESFSAIPPENSGLVVSTPSDPTTIKPSKLSSSPVGPTTPMAVMPNPTTEEFIASICEPAREIGQQRGLYASVMIAQAILESGSGSSGLSKPPNNNLFGIKGSYQGQSAYMLTSEDDGSGGKYDIMSHFRRYPSVRESLQDYADLLTCDMADYYSPAWKANAPTYVQACDYLQGHYATDTSYSSKLQGLILAYDLEQYDHPAKVAALTSANGGEPDAVFTIVEQPPSPEYAFTVVAGQSSQPSRIDVDVVSKDSLDNMREDESPAVDDGMLDLGPLGRHSTRNVVALTAAGLLAAAVGFGRRALVAFASKSFLPHLLGFLRF